MPQGNPEISIAVEVLGYLFLLEECGVWSLSEAKHGRSLRRQHSRSLRRSTVAHFACKVRGAKMEVRRQLNIDKKSALKIWHKNPP